MSGKLRIKHVHPSELTPHPENPRDPDPSRQEKLKIILDRFGFVAPLVVNTRTGYLVGGHRRLEVALEEEYDEVPIVEIDVDTDEERALLVALNNQEAQGTWNTPMLVDVLTKLEASPLFEATGFDYDQFQRIALEAAGPAFDTKSGREGEVPPTPDSPDARHGDVYQLGRHILVVGSALEATSYQHMPKPAAMTFTDPPYNVNYEGGTSDRLRMMNDHFPDEGSYAAFMADSLKLIAQHTDGAIYVCYANLHNIAVHTALEEANIHLSSVIAWVKDRFTLGRSDYHWQWEPIAYGWPAGKDHYWIGDRNQGNVWEHKKPKKADRGRAGPSNVWRHQRPAANRLHPTMKPVTLVEQALRNSSQPGDWILDAFSGSGSTLAAAENTGRHCYAIELDPSYADVIIARWASLSGGEPTKINT